MFGEKKKENVLIDSRLCLSYFKLYTPIFLSSKQSYQIVPSHFTDERDHFIEAQEVK